MLTSTGRPRETSLRNRPGLFKVTMSNSSTREDIQMYVSTQVEERPGLCDLSVSIKEHIKNVLPEKADGTYDFFSCLQL